MESGIDAAQRIEELENALRRTIEYLERLPFHPMTKRAATNAESVLNNNKILPQQQQYSSASFDPVGVLLFSVRASGKIITLNTVSVTEMPGHYRDRHRDIVYNMLVRGVTMPPLQVVDNNSSSNNLATRPPTTTT